MAPEHDGFRFPRAPASGASWGRRTAHRACSISCSRADAERTAKLGRGRDEHDPDRIAGCYSARRHRSHSAPRARGEILAGLGFSHAERARLRRIFRRVAHAGGACRGAVRRRADLLLLDEPWCIDLEAALWLEAHRAIITLIIVIDHDRDLLGGGRALDPHLERRKTRYRGGWRVRAPAERQALDLKLAKKQEAQRRRRNAFVDRFRAKAQGAPSAGALDSWPSSSRSRSSPKVRPIRDPVAQRAGKKLAATNRIALEDVAVGYQPGRPVLRRLSLRIDDDDRIALVGANGNGKSTLVKLVAGRLAPMSGQVTRAKARRRLLRPASARRARSA